MNPIAFFGRMRWAYNNWTETLEELIQPLPKDLAKSFRQLHTRRKGLSVSGLGTLLFGEMFNLNTDPIVSNVTAAINFGSGYLDDYIDLHDPDPSFTETMLDDLLHFSETGTNDNEFLTRIAPIVQYIREQFDTKINDGILDAFKYYKDASVAEMKANTPDDRESARIKIADGYSMMLSHTLNAFSENQLTPNQWQAIKLFTRSSVLLDDLCDMYPDADSKAGSYVMDRIKQSGSTIKVIYDQARKIQTNFKEGKKLIQNYDDKRLYQDMANSANIAVSYRFFTNYCKRILGKSWEKIGY